jgi:hypothetical protein
MTESTHRAALVTRVFSAPTDPARGVERTLHKRGLEIAVAQR